MSYARTFKRNAVKRIQGNNRIAKLWEQIRRGTVGDKRYEVDYVRCDPKKRHALHLLNRDGSVIR